MRSFINTPLRSRIRSGLGAFNGLKIASALEQWNLSSCDVVITSDSGTPGSPSAGYSTQSPTAAVTAASAMAWSAINSYDSSGGWTPISPRGSYAGFPEYAQVDGPWPGSPYPLGDGYPVATGTYTTTSNWGQQVIFVDQTGSGAQMLSVSGLVVFPYSGSTPQQVYPMTVGVAPGSPWTSGGVNGSLTASLMSCVLFAPFYMGAVPVGTTSYVWASCQLASRTRYRLQHPYGTPGLPGIRLNCELWVRGTSASGYPASGWGAAASDWSLYPAYPTVNLVVVPRNFSFNSYLSLASTSNGASASGTWYEPSLPNPGWSAATAAANAATGFLGLATMDFWGFRTPAQWTDITGLPVS